MKKLAALLLVSLLVIAAGCIGGSSQSPSQSSQQSSSSSVQIIKLGALLDLSGPIASDGKKIKNALELAQEDINRYFSENNMNFKVEIYFEDTRTDPKVALEKVQTLDAQGIKVIIGPTSSGELKNMRSYVAAHKIVVISEASTAPPKFIGFASPEEKKYVFRFVPTDLFQSEAIAAELKSKGIKGLVILYRGDAWGKGLHDATIEQIKGDIEIAEDISYPSNPEPTDWSPYISKAEDGINSLLSKYSADQVAVWVIGFDEIATLLSQIPDDSELLSVKWFGSDGNVLSDKIVEEAGDKASKVALFSTQFYAQSDAGKKLIERFKEKFGIEPSEYALIAYDAAWVAALSYAEVLKENGTYDPDLMVEKIKEILSKYSSGELSVSSVTGDIELDEWNDRASGDYAIWAVKDGSWEMVGLWKSSTGEVEWH
ncbi:ABC transporter substrate-binding protein [Thermococcus sp. GR7]|uniref:ABC transporter substrate-binding protein n=1 Tax=unclassified Thermococcus TaxID=2627626 RepID=UPI001431A6CB|nr:MULTISPECIES: ABC transporter substrate-binding protein [unclassified Thermococcus]NJE47012.1 ABC transporter substrate-binding protein [Thermococcus sp. GR7]NJE78163.1 ABC transporter substrate-binding protein [Thermococcus sp. GR4]NJF22720.1 ABC transporter substrate-binding protein [Thermococcus sp. GR5]